MSDTASGTDPILLKLVIQGMDPTELQQMAELTGQQLTTALQDQLGKVTDLHRQAATADTAEVAKGIQAQMLLRRSVGTGEDRFMAALLLWDLMSRGFCPVGGSA